MYVKIEHNGNGFKTYEEQVAAGMTLEHLTDNYYKLESINPTPEQICQMFGYESAETDKIVIEEGIYRNRVVKLIRSQYSADDEFDLHNNVTDAIATGAEELPATYVEYREYVETCKDTAYREVYGIERV